MIVNCWYIVYIDVLSGHPGVYRVTAYDQEDAKKIFINNLKNAAIIEIMEGKM